VTDPKHRLIGAGNGGFLGFERDMGLRAAWGSAQQSDGKRCAVNDFHVAFRE
jgi:hypothetical protein